MSRVERLSKRSLHKILSGRLKKDELPAFFVIKFYSNGCHYCHALQEDFVKIAEENDDGHFFAFNIDDEPSIQNTLNFNGVPTICSIYMDSREPRIRFIEEPQQPHKQKLYYAKDINSFIQKEKMRNER